MARHDYDLGVIGGGAAGLSVAAGAARLGAKVLLVDRSPLLGGDCLHHGCVPSKTLIRVAEIRHLQSRAAEFGLPPVNPGPVDFAQVAGRIREVIAAIQPHDSAERFQRLGVDLRVGTPEFTDEHTVSLEGKRLSARFWTIATGSSPALPPFPGLDTVDRLTNRELFSLERLPRSMIVLGGGAMAVEMAQAFCRLGCAVSVIQRSPQILSREDPDLAAIVRQALEREGVAFHLGATVRQISKTDAGTSVRFVQGNGPERTVTAEALLVATGRVANTAGLGLASIGVVHDEKGIRVDGRMRTSQPHIFAPGDVNGAHQFTHAAGYEAGIVVSNAVFRLPRRADYTLMPRCVYSQPELACVGLSETEARKAGIEHSVWTETFADNDRARAEGETDGCVKVLLDRRGRPIGVQIVGPRAGDLVCEWVAAMGGKVSLATLAGAVHPYPTLAEINKRVAGSYLASKIFSGPVRRVLKFLFTLRGGPPSDPRAR